MAFKWSPPQHYPYRLCTKSSFHSGCEKTTNGHSAWAPEVVLLTPFWWLLAWSPVVSLHTCTDQYKGWRGSRCRFVELTLCVTPFLAAFCPMHSRALGFVECQPLFPLLSGTAGLHLAFLLCFSFWKLPPGGNWDS